MLFTLYSLGKITGAEVMLVGVLLCAALYLGMSLLCRASRTKRGIRAVLLGLLCAEAVCDIGWFCFYFSGGEYHNYGIGGVFGAALWPLALLFVGGVAAAVNSGREE